MGVHYHLPKRSKISTPKGSPVYLSLQNPSSIHTGTTRSADITGASLKPVVEEGLVPTTADPATWFNACFKHGKPVSTGSDHIQDVLHWSNNQTLVSDWSNIQQIRHDVSDESSPSARVDFSLLRIIIFLSVLWSVAAVGPDIQARAKLIKDLPSGIFAGEKLQPKTDEKTLIDMSLSLRSLDLEYSSGTFKVSGWMKLKWQDDRYKWDPHLYENIESVALPFSKVWSPDVMLHNGLEDKFMFSKVGILEYTGDITYMIAIHSKSACNPNFTDFPWGVQVCSLKFGSWINAQYKVEYRLPPESSIGLSEYETSVGWKIVNTSSRLQSVQHPLDQEPTHLVVFDIAFSRDTYFDGAFGVLRRENRTLEL